ncbi:MAG: hypothetical protein HZA64_11745 [Rhodocyclales bacterium]|nr:hypothetical protein [Rhodocyclales bacterium]
MHKNLALIASLTLALAACGSMNRPMATSALQLSPTDAHLPPGARGDFQKAATGQVLPHHLGLMLRTADGAPLNGVGIAPRDLKLQARYTGGLLVQDSNGDKLLDPVADKVVGGIIGAAPAGARGQSATSPRGTDGKPILSGEVQGKPGLMPVEFRTGDQPGLYRPTFELMGGNSHQFTLEAIAGR